MSSSNNKKTLLRTIFTANGSCGCRKTKASEVHEPTPKPKISNIHHTNATNPSNMTSSSFSFTPSHNGGFSLEDKEDSTSTTVISESESESETTRDHNNINNKTKQSPLVDSVAVEKDSSDPYHDFRHSMLQMIFEKEIESEDDLRDLLQCFLQLNASPYHDVIVKVFNEICQQAFPQKVSITPADVAATQRSPEPRGSEVIEKK